MAAGPSRPLTIAWFTYFPVEWLDEAPEEIRSLPRMHPATWQRVLFQEFRKETSLRLHIIALRKQFRRSLSFELDNAMFHCVRVPGGFRAPSLFWWDTIEVSRILRKIQPDLVHAWGSENGAASIATRLGYPSVVTMQGIMGWMKELGVAGAYQKFAAVLEHSALRRLRHVSAESSFAIQYLGARYPNLRLQQIEHAPNWLFHSTPRHPQLSPRRFINVGTLSHAKGTDVLLAALDRLCGTMEFELVIVGGASQEAMDAYRRSCSAKLWERIVFRNHLTPEQLALELSRSALMIYPSRADNSPNAVKEAVAAGLPVVASAVGGIVDYVLPGENGFLFPPGDVEGCVRSIQQACGQETLGMGIVPPHVLSPLRAHLSPRTMAGKFLSLYQTAAV